MSAHGTKGGNYMNSIYVVTSIHVEDSACVVTRKRTVGWLPTLAEAILVVTDNEGDIYEAGHYNHCVIEEVWAGLYPSIGRKEGQEWWFKWAHKDKYTFCEHKTTMLLTNETTA